MATGKKPTLNPKPAAGAEPSEDEIPPEKSTKKSHASTKEAKPKKPAAPRKRSSPSHPPYFEMIQGAIATLKDKTGSSQYAISKLIEENQKHLPPNFKKLLLVQLRKLVASGKLVKVKSSYKLPSGLSAAKLRAADSVVSKTKRVTASKAKSNPTTAGSVKDKPAVKADPISKGTSAPVKPKASSAPVKPKAAPKRKKSEDINEKKPVAKVTKVSASGAPGMKKKVAKKAPVKSVKPKSPAKKAIAKRRKK